MSNAESPENLIRGEWRELSWEYEKVDLPLNKGMDYAQIFPQLKQRISQDLIIHQAETWRFLPNGELILSDGEKEKKVKWRMKGRGHILQLIYDEDTFESYNLSELNDDTLVLNFESDIQARGIAKLTFERIKN
jgi:hypothetical protein